MLSHVLVIISVTVQQQVDGVSWIGPHSGLSHRPPHVISCFLLLHCSSRSPQVQSPYFFHVPYFFQSGSHSEKEILRIVTNELLGILDAWGEACEWLTVRKICPQRHYGEKPYPDFKLWIWGHSCAWMTSPDRAGMHRCRKLGAQDPGKGDAWDTTKALLTTSYSPPPSAEGPKDTLKSDGNLWSQ